MGKIRVTDEEFIARCRKIHEDFYTYSFAHYSGTNKKVTVTCPVHGNFDTTAGSHLSGRGCMKCYRDRQGSLRQIPHEEWINRCNEAHNSHYDYSMVEYKNQKQRVTVICPQHGGFEALAGEHMLGGAYCRSCRTRPPGTPRSTQEHYIGKVTLVHGDKYDYSKVNYIKLSDKIEVICKEHGPFLVRAGNHATGRGCPACAKNGFKVHVPATLYILEDKNLVKIGVTNRKVLERVKNINKSSGKNFSICSSFNFEFGRDAIRIETILLNEFTGLYTQPSEVFDGCTECFFDLDKSYLIKRIGELLST